ncbi:cytochrome c oxidase assembly protein COX11, mitochondrial isoform X1 [Erpetoichthys calabaricus]|uniref:Cytochrome c oxidase assembly protein COX11, mitochondrial n=1 Tax=Erpetoichthys calabaricus TaxID=27687 RepID=A0A8C4SV16_ERPCA|nr:cytochrome c oxidase assembly protein COX11, mitochondrial isoform X1 [Erpetoichthys calabaricus]XP_028675199.1 cytochrome c oxidase assembly protein COX11, mitochondrial isoform X1 [Erpetoichthys calabaricus]XP_051792266.1 cytochrome c oxidase assembly protein COX11, mitochondrial isoform X1 [Erpetoichthys calabaricus]
MMLWKKLSYLSSWTVYISNSRLPFLSAYCQYCTRGLSYLVCSGTLRASNNQLFCQRKSLQHVLSRVQGMKRGHNPFTKHQKEEWQKRNKTVLTYIAAAGVGMIGLSYAAVPLYRLYCQATGLGGTAVAGHSSDQIENMQPVKDRVLKVTFNADVHASLQWNFRPQQSEIYVVPGETALAFYKAKNPTNKPVIGISTYNIVPFEAGQYFNKIQCFCFEEQRLNPNEEVDMPVFFYIDPEFDTDPRMANVDTITLSYTFFEAKDGHKLSLPGYS